MNKLLILSLGVVLSFFANAEIVTDDEGCSATKLQTMKIGRPSSGHQGYGVVSFDIKADGSVTNIKGQDSQCVVSRNADESILFKKCPYFKKSSYSAARYLKFSPPKTVNGSSCTLKNQQQRFTYSRYKIKFDDPDQFWLPSDFDQKRRNDIDYNEKLPSLFYPMPQDSGPPLSMPIEPPNGPSIPNGN